MTTATSSVAFAASLVAIGTSVGFLVTILRYRNDPTTRPLIGVALTLVVGAIVHLAIVDLVAVRAALGMHGRPTGLFGGYWLLLAFDLPAVVSGFWFLFALQYTGRDKQTAPIAYIAVGGLLVLLVTPTFALALLGSVTPIATSTLNVLLGVTLILAESLALIGVFLVVATTSRYKAFPAGQTALLTLAVTPMLVLPFVATTLQYPVATPSAVIVSGLLFTAAVRRYRIFETLPVASVVSRDRVIDEMSEGVLMVDETGRIRGLNPTAETLLGVQRHEILRSQVGEILPALPPGEELSGSDPVEVHLESDRILAVSADSVTDHRNRALGSLLVLRDVTDKRQQEHRLGVLTQLLAGAMQEEMSAVTATVDEVASGALPEADGANRIHDTATDIATLVSRVRALERALAAEGGSDPVTADADEVLSTLRESPHLDVTTVPADRRQPLQGNPALLTATLETLATNPAPGEQPPTLAMETDTEAVTFTIAPFEPQQRDTLADRSLEVARLVAAQTDWDIRLSEAGAQPAVIVSLPTGTGNSTRPHQSGERA